MMTLDDIRHIVRHNLGEQYYNIVNDLNNDLLFFNMYLQRNKQSKHFCFEIIPFMTGEFNSYLAVYAAFGYHSNPIEYTVCVCCMMKAIISDIYRESHGFTEQEIKDFSEYLKTDLDLKLEDYVADFVGCGRGVAGVKAKLYEILYKEEQENG